MTCNRSWNDDMLTKLKRWYASKVEKMVCHQSQGSKIRGGASNFNEIDERQNDLRRIKNCRIAKSKQLWVGTRERMSIKCTEHKLQKKPFRPKAHEIAYEGASEMDPVLYRELAPNCKWPTCTSIGQNIKKSKRATLNLKFSNVTYTTKKIAPCGDTQDTKDYPMELSMTDEPPLGLGITINHCCW